MTKQKAMKHLKSSREHFEFYRELYVQNERDTNTNLDLVLMVLGKSIRQERREEYINEMNTAKERIAKFERIVL